MMQYRTFNEVIYVAYCVCVSVYSTLVIYLYCRLYTIYVALLYVQIKWRHGLS